jgi:hypothetical protein
MTSSSIVVAQCNGVVRLTRAGMCIGHADEVIGNQLTSGDGTLRHAGAVRRISRDEDDAA